MKIYTKTGDKGMTSLFGGQRVYKDDKRVHAYGTIDELNSLLGVVIASSAQKEINHDLEQIQMDLFAIGASLANPAAKSLESLEERTKYLEKRIDAMTEELEELQNFILPGGSITGSLLHLARSVVRRAEREIVAVMQGEQIDKGIVFYMNRLSDLFFTMARFVNMKEEKKEVIWKQ